MPAKLTLEDCIDFASNKGGECLSNCYIHGRSKMKWKCDKGHIWKANFIDIRAGSWCHIYGRSKKLDIQECINFAISKNGKCLSTKYKNARSLLKWQCRCGFIWENTFDKIKNRKQWCPKCAKNKKYTLEEVREIVNKRGGILYSDQYINANSKLKVKCKKCDRYWRPTLGNILSGKWCLCDSLNKNHKKLFNIIDKLFPNLNKFNNYKGFKWLRYKKRQEIDIWVPDLKLAIEYDGEQHFRPVCFGGISKEDAKVEFQKTKLLDKNKDLLISIHKKEVKFFIRFNYKEDINEEYVRLKLTKLGVIKELYDE